MSETKSLDYFLELTKGQNLQKKKKKGGGGVNDEVDRGRKPLLDMRITWQESGK